MPNLTSVAELLDIEQQLGSSRSMKMPRIVLYQYPGSPWGAKVAFYLALRGIAYSECHQPMTWPRPDLEPLGIRYRRIPIMAIGRDIYYDSSLIFDKLEVLYAENRMGATKPSEQALEKLTERWVETCVLPSVFSLLPTELPFVKDEKFLQDRMTLWGEDMSAKAISSGRSRSLVEMQGHFAFLERLLQDGRTWLQDTPEPSLTDIHAVFLIDWLSKMPGALPNNFFPTDVYPRTWAWLGKFQSTLAECQGRTGAPILLAGPDAAKQILASDFGEPQGMTSATTGEEEDPTGLKRGQLVAVYRNDDIISRTKHRDIGRLMSLTPHEIVVAIGAGTRSEVRVHCPRWQFAIEGVEE
ncbi:hypothetical protein AtubIFM57143_003789 [Aspergillus tubingensis]|nr:hypothetical protein AtubIFM57143_003789 [Aspergillus tubingensis]